MRYQLLALMALAACKDSPKTQPTKDPDVEPETVRVTQPAGCELSELSKDPRYDVTFCYPTMDECAYVERPDGKKVPRSEVECVARNRYICIGDECRSGRVDCKELRRQATEPDQPCVLYIYDPPCP